MSSTLGNLFPLIQTIDALNAPKMSYLNNQYDNLEEWRLSARNELLALLRYSPPPSTQPAQIVEVVDCGSYTREKLYFQSAANVSVPAYLLLPKGRTAPVPGTIALHDHGGFYTFGKEKLVEIEDESAELTEFKRTAYSGRSYASELAKRGYAVIIIDAFYFGERRINFDTVDDDIRNRLASRISTLVEKVSEYHGQCSVFEEMVARHIIAAGATWLGVMSHDDRASVSYLCSRPEVDPTRIGCLGLSMGGHRNNYLTATDPRIKAAVTVGWMSNWRDLLPDHVRSHSWAQFVPGLASSFELSDVVSIGMPAALFVQQCARDELFSSEAMHRASDQLTKIYTKAGLSARFQSRFYDVTHQFNAEMQLDAFNWLDQWLQ